ncbi:MAG: S1C family serine protease [Lachnospiraceae bacterium]|nr:S1C family serine protease [Lachnospiraceae bacterium]
MKGWKKYGAVAMAAVVTASVCAQGSVLYRTNQASAQETEETQRVTLNIVKDEEETESSETEKTTGATGAQETVAGDTESSAETVSDPSDEESERVTLNRESDSAASSDAETDAEEETEKTEMSESEEETEAYGETSGADSGEITLGSGQTIDTVERVSDSASLTDVSEIVENCLPSIVSVTVVSEADEESSDSAYDSYYGMEITETEAETLVTTVSGVIIAQSEEELLIATGYQAVSDAENLTVTFSVDAEDTDDLTVSAKVKGTSASSGLAVLAVELEEIEASVLSQLKIANPGSSEELKMGQTAVVLSDCGYGMTATIGIISATNLTVTLNDVSMEVILTDAADGSSSGGALLNTFGELIGICVTDDSGDAADGIGYAIPIDTAIPILEQLINKETRDKLSDSERGYIGATVLTVSEEATGTYNMPAGAFVYEVTEGSAADEAGIQSGDIISAIEGESVSSSTELIEKMSYYAPGETITLEVQTANNGTYEAREVEVTLQAASGSASTSAEDSFSSDEDGDSSDGESSGRSSDGFSDEFDDGFSDGFEDYNNQFN